MFARARIFPDIWETLFKDDVISCVFEHAVEENTMLFEDVQLVVDEG